MLFSPFLCVPVALVGLFTMDVMSLGVACFCRIFHSASVESNQETSMWSRNVLYMFHFFKLFCENMQLTEKVSCTLRWRRTDFFCFELLIAAPPSAHCDFFFTGRTDVKEPAAANAVNPQLNCRWIFLDFHLLLHIVHQQRALTHCCFCHFIHLRATSDSPWSSDLLSWSHKILPFPALFDSFCTRFRF